MSESDFDCNVCLEAATEPVVTRCGHLYCWKCIHEWISRGQDECPTCKAGVTKENVIPIYGRGATGVDPRTKSESSGSTSRPDRPKAERPEARGRRVGFFDVFGDAFEGSGGVTFGIFPFGFFGMWNITPSGGTQEERHQDIVSKVFVFVGLVLIWILVNT